MKDFLKILLISFLYEPQVERQNRERGNLATWMPFHGEANLWRNVTERLNWIRVVRALWRRKCSTRVTGPKDRQKIKFTLLPIWRLDYAHPPIRPRPIGHTFRPLRRFPSSGDDDASAARWQGKPHENVSRIKFQFPFSNENRKGLHLPEETRRNPHKVSPRQEKMSV